MCSSRLGGYEESYLQWLSEFAFRQYLELPRLLETLCLAIHSFPMRSHYLVSRSSECPLISFDKDHPKTILNATITLNLISSLVVGSSIDCKISLPTSKSRAKSKPPAKRNLITSRSASCPARLRAIVFTYAISAIITEVPMMTAAETSMPNVIMWIMKLTNCSSEVTSICPKSLSVDKCIPSTYWKADVSAFAMIQA